MSDIFHPDRRVVCDLWVFCDKFPRHEGDIPCRGHMFQRIRKSAAVNKFCVLHSESFCPLIHHLHECPLIASGNDASVAMAEFIGGDDDALDQGLHRLDLALLQKHLGSAHRFRMSACHHLVCQVDLSRLQGVKDQDQCHDLRDTGRISRLICVLLTDHGSRGCFHEDRRRGCDLRTVTGSFSWHSISAHRFHHHQDPGHDSTKDSFPRSHIFAPDLHSGPQKFSARTLSHSVRHMFFMVPADFSL